MMHLSQSPTPNEELLSGNVLIAAVEGAKERDEGNPTSGAWGWSVERCLSSGGEMKAK